MILKYSDEVIRAERACKYREAMHQTYIEYLADKSDHTLMLALLEHWYLSFNMDCLRENTTSEWDELLDAAYDRIDDDPLTAFFMGYMMAVGPYLFLGERWGTSGESYIKIQDSGYQLMERAYSIEPDRLIFKIKHSHYIDESLIYEKRSETELIELQETFPVPSVICEYFRRIFDADEYEENLPIMEDYRNRLIHNMSPVKVRQRSESNDTL
ncbi:MAG: hypothetical protein IKP26_06940 [Clostridia bacterium]|nr:hypothetical protein [Clostridia bacterium]